MKPYKMNNGIWVDLSQIQAIGEVTRENDLLHNNLYVEFSVMFAFRDNMVVYGDRITDYHIPANETFTYKHIKQTHLDLLEAWKNQ